MSVSGNAKGDECARNDNDYDYSDDDEEENVLAMISGGGPRYSQQIYNLTSGKNLGLYLCLI